MATPAPLPFHEFLASQAFLEYVIRPSGSVAFAAYIARLTGDAVQITVGPQTKAPLRPYWEVTVRHQPDPVAVRLTWEEAVEAAQQIRHFVGGAANIWTKGADGQYQEEWTYPRWRDPRSSGG